MEPSTDRTIDLDGFNTIVRGRDATYMALKTDIYVGQSLIRYGEYCEAEIELLKQLTQPGDHVAEIGSNLGAHGVRLAKHIGPSGRLVAVEPQPVIFQAMAATMSLNSLSNVDCWPYALSSEPGILALPPFDYSKDQNFGGISMIDLPDGKLPVPVHRFDDIYFYNQLNLMKIDVEGMELDVLKGAANCIEKYRPRIYLENDREESSPALIQWLFDAGYKLWWHMPPLYNPVNYFKNPDNMFGNVVSINMVAIHSSTPTNTGLEPVTSVDGFPRVTQSAKPKIS